MNALPQEALAQTAFTAADFGGFVAVSVVIVLGLLIVHALRPWLGSDLEPPADWP